MSTPLESARDALAAAEAEMDRLRADADERGRTWDAAIQALGAEPRIRTEPKEPVPPPRPRPTPEDLAAAVALDAHYPAARALFDRYTADRERLDIRVEETSAAQAEADNVAGRNTATLQAARQAPSAIAAEMLDRLALPPGIAAAFTPKGMDLTLDGRAWDSPGSRRYAGHSSGREVSADLELRVRLRALAAERIGKAWGALPVVVDDEVLLDAGGSLPDVGGAVIVLRTSADGALGVVSNG